MTVTTIRYESYRTPDEVPVSQPISMHFACLRSEDVVHVVCAQIRAGGRAAVSAPKSETPEAIASWRVCVRMFRGCSSRRKLLSSP